jgi:hypothetical protein
MGAQAATLDIAAAYRCVPCLPDHKRFLVVRSGNDFFMDHAIPFGIASAHYLLGEVADATLDIITAQQKEQAWDVAEDLRSAQDPNPTTSERRQLVWKEGEASALALASDGEAFGVEWKDLGVGPSLKWVDDHVFFRYPSLADMPFQSATIFRYAYDLDDIRRFTLPLGVPWHKTKGTDFSPTVLYLGFVWDLPERSVALQESKRIRYAAKVEDLIGQICRGSRLSQKSVESINGMLSHVCFVVPHGRSYLPNLSRFICTFTSKYHPRYAPASVKSDLLWWSSWLNSAHGPRSLKPRGRTQDLDLWVDASTSWGIGLCVGQSWDAWRLRLLPGWEGQGRDIGWAEAVAIELVIRVLEAMGLENASVLICSDNQGVIGSFARGRGRIFQVNHVIRRAETIGLATNVSHELTYVRSELNRADPLSRGELGPLSRQVASHVQLPEELIPFLVHV